MKINIAYSDSEKLRIYQFRYQVYVNEIGLKQTYADHAQGIIKEPLDDTAVLLYALDGDEIVGVCRLNYAKHGNLAFYPELYKIEQELEESSETIVIVSKLLVHKSYRKRSVAHRIMCESYKIAMGDGMRQAFIDFVQTNELFKLYTKLGYLIHLPEVNHPDTGQVCVCKIAMDDIEFLREVRSPYARLYDNMVEGELI